MNHNYRISTPNGQLIVSAETRGDAVRAFLKQSGMPEEFFQKHCSCKICTYSPEIPDSLDKNISPTEFANLMRHEFERTHGEPEAFHDEADRLMMRVLRQLGYGEGVDFFDEQEVWYA